MNLLTFDTTQKSLKDSTELLILLGTKVNLGVVCTGASRALIYTSKGYFLLANNCSVDVRYLRIVKPNSRKLFGNIKLEKKSLEQIAKEIAERIKG